MSSTSAQGIRRAAVFAHFDRDGLVDDHVMHYIRSLAKVAERIVFVTTADIGVEDEHRLEGICSKVVRRRNEGYDFMSYKTGIELVELDQCDEVLLCNDSVYGPLRPLDEVFENMAQTTCDFWGITESYEEDWHLQSYFLVFRRSVLQGSAFRGFWEGVRPERSKQAVVEKYELGLSGRLRDAGFRGKSYVRYSPSFTELVAVFTRIIFRQPIIDRIRKLLFDRAVGGGGEVMAAVGRPRSFGRRLNPTHYFWRGTIQRAGMPFIKVELLRDNPEGVNVSDYANVIQKHGEYDTTLIKRHLERMKRSLDSAKKVGGHSASVI